MYNSYTNLEKECKDMKLNYAILAAFLGAVYLVVKEYLPDFPVSLEVILALLVYVLGKLGVEVVDQPVRKLFK